MANDAINLLGNEFTFDVDASQLPCGLNGALYFVTMDPDGGQARFPANNAGAKFGTGYCDAQCPMISTSSTAQYVCPPPPKHYPTNNAAPRQI